MYEPNDEAFDASPMDELYRKLTPARTVLMRRVADGQDETLWISAYPDLVNGAGLVVQTLPALTGHDRTLPGVISEHWTNNVAGLMARTIASRQKGGWTVSPSGVWVDDPWNVTAIFDQPAGF